MNVERMAIVADVLKGAFRLCCPDGGMVAY